MTKPTTPPLTERLFVYGTLAPGRPNEHVLAAVPGTWEAASVRGTLVQAGWGAAVGYPGIVLSDSGELVRGFVFTSDALAGQLAALDAFEGEGYERVRARAELASGEVVEAHVYALARPPAT